MKEWRLESKCQPGRPRMPWTAARTTKMLRQCPLTVVQQLVYYAITVSTAVWNSHKDNVHSSAVEKRLMQKKSTFKPSSTSLLLVSSGLTWGSSITSLLLISPEPAEVFNFFVRVQLTSLFLISPGLCKRHHTKQQRPESPTVTHQHCHIIEQYFRIFREKV